MSDEETLTSIKQDTKDVAEVMARKQNIVFIGNPGVGKSTLLNCYMKSLQDDIPNDRFFKSGLSVGKGLTYELDIQEIDGKVFMDTPGLEDIRMRQKAAEAITKALKQNGLYKVVFVVTLEAGRVRTVDNATINLVLNNAPEITHFGLIFNKLSDQLYKKLEAEDDKEKLLDEFMLHITRSADGDEKPIPLPLLLRKFNQLDDHDDETICIPEFEKFMKKLPPIAIRKENVGDIPGDTSLEALVKKLEQSISELKADNQKLRHQIEKDRRESQQKINEMIEREKQRHKENLEELKLCYKEALRKQQEATRAEIESVVNEHGKMTTIMMSQISAENEQRNKLTQSELAEQRNFYQAKLKETGDAQYNTNQDLLKIQKELELAKQQYDELIESTANKSFWSKVKAFFL